MKFNNNDLVYLAGYLDGEGCFSLHGGTTSVVCNTTCKETMYWLEKFGGKTSPIKTPTRYKKQYRWGIHGAAACALCIKLIPFLKEKKLQAQCLLDWYSLGVFPGRKKLPRSLLKKRDMLKRKIIKLKHVSV